MEVDKLTHRMSVLGMRSRCHSLERVLTMFMAPIILMKAIWHLPPASLLLLIKERVLAVAIMTSRANISIFCQSIHLAEERLG